MEQVDFTGRIIQNKLHRGILTAIYETINLLISSYNWKI